MSDVWYERPIKVRAVHEDYKTVVENGYLGEHGYPHTHYWTSLEEQRQDIAELVDLWHVICFENASNSFHSVIYESYRKAQDAICPCGSHNGSYSVGECCDTNDCGPCCDKCPTCPTLHPDLGQPWPGRELE